MQKAFTADLSEGFPLFFSHRFLRQQWAIAEPRRYERKISGDTLVVAIASALLDRMAGLRQIVAKCEFLPTNNFSSLSPALSRVSGITFLRRLLSTVEEHTNYRAGELVALDSMAVTIGKTRRHACVKYNNKAVGGGALWSFRVKADKGSCPVRLLKIMRGAWHDSKLMRDVALESRGPIYLMDRGFYCIDLIGQWLHQKVRFIVRVKARCLVYEVVKHLDKRSCLPAGWRVELDAIVLLGTKKRGEKRPKVRLIIAYRSSGEQFIFATSENRSSAGYIIESYKKRWCIERFHRFLKDTLGLAHLYSFKAEGLEFMILTALLTAILLFLNASTGNLNETLEVMRAALKSVQKLIGLDPPRQRNVLAVKRTQRKEKRVPRCTQNL